VFREIAEQILPDLSIAPDTEIKATPELMAQVAETPAIVIKQRGEAQLQKQTRGATLPEVSRGGRDGEVVYAAATRNAIVMPDLRGRSVRDVARTCAQLGLQIEARGDGRVLRQNPGPGAEVANGQLVYLDFGREN